jgi:hypothetical protein
VITLAVIFGGLWLLEGAFELVSFQLTPWRMARGLDRYDPQASQIPVALPDQSLAALGEARIEVFGLSIDTPWEKIVSQKTLSSFSFWNFRDGAHISIIKDADWGGLASRERKDARAVRVLGEDALRSEFALMTAAMYATPDQVKWWKFPPQNLRAMSLIEEKGHYCNKYGRIYAISFGRMRGFQEGDPDEAPYKVALNLFGPDDHHYEIEITGAQGKPLPLTQAQLNSMVASIQLAPNN